MKTIYIFTNGTLIRKDNTLVLDTGEEKKHLPIENIRDLFVFSEVTLNKRLLEFLTKYGIAIHFFNHYGYYTGTYYPREHLNSGHLIVKQVECYIDPARRINLAKGFVTGAARNILHVIGYCRKSHDELQTIIENVKGFAEGIPKTKTIEGLMGIEGNIRDAYYSSFDPILSRKGFSYSGRSRRPPKTPLNSLISFGNMLMYSTLLTEIYKTHLDPRIGYLHATNFRRFTLNLDVSEIFKPIIVDRTIFSVIQNKEIVPEDFEESAQGLLMTEKAKRLFVQRYDEHLDATFHHRRVGKVSYRKVIRMELYKIEKHLIGDTEYEPFISQW
ncbi:type I-B CRISPR-associated endonuclease Cas1b [Methanofollis fontis]|uniref:CRISPR-associated endonuclease Cas1 n=1 Tax=Methanofollis fontis TaxID=2052832 RepID=A0A483CVI1_9EURY|nr:type I-B CRISPR-associated endonuclease Cas1b [Methanofollis fontis]TAJ44997.1 subtype I-B CRISPR-associated endonuclease Cas1 [Methanofollis fontis]